MRFLALALVTLVAARGAAHADEDPDFVPFPSKSVAFGVQGHGTRIGGRSEAGFGPMLELALGRGRWQYLAEAAFASSRRDDWTPAADETRIEGRLLRGGFGLRWLARQFMPGSNSGIELFLHTLAGVQRYSFDDGGKLTRPEVSFGFGIQGRIYRRPRIAFRLDARLVFTPNDRESSLVSCRGMCMSETGSSTGFMMGTALAW